MRFIVKEERAGTKFIHLKDEIPDGQFLGGLTIFAFFSAAIGDMIKPFELEGVQCCAPRRF